jgi:hypothetical protein
MNNVPIRHYGGYLCNAVGVNFPCGLSNSELTSGPIGQAFILTRKRVVEVGRLRNRSIGCSTGFVEGQAGTSPRQSQLWVSARTIRFGPVR